MNLSILKPLQAGDKVDLVAPGARPAEGVLEKACAFLKSWGLIPRWPADIYGSDPFYAHTLEKRVTFLKDALTAPDSQAVWCLGGGNGSTRLLPFLASHLPLREKYFIGFSDVTALHLFLHQAWGWRPLHGPTLGQLVRDMTDTATEAALRRQLLEGRSTPLAGLAPLNQAAKAYDQRPLEARQAPLVGGNASLVQASLGTPWQIQTTGCHVFLEDVDERPYRTLERLEHMRQAGLFEGAKALLLFDFTFNDPAEAEKSPPSLYVQAFDQFAREVSLPIFRGTGVGHGKRNLPLVIGAPYTYQRGELREGV